MSSSQGPPVWSNSPISTLALAHVLSGGLPGAAPPESSQNNILGVDYIPPLNAQAGIKIPERSLEETKVLLRTIGFTSWSSLPEAFSWHDPQSIREIKGWPWTKSPLLPPPSQYACGSCWAWSSANVLSDRFAIFTGEPNPNLSPTYLLSCLGQDEQCNGGFPADAGHFMERQGLPKMSCWDYSWCTNSPRCVESGSGVDMATLNATVPQCASDLCKRDCQSNSCSVSINLKKYKARPQSTVALTDPRSIQLEIFQHGPVVAVYRVFGDFLAGSMDRKIYPQADGWAKTRGVYIHIANRDVYGYGSMNCQGAREQSHECFMGNHAVAIVGWGLEKNVPNFLRPESRSTLDIPYWIVRNSWGTQWNGNGFFKMAFSDPDLGFNMEVALDRPLRIREKLFGAATTFLPDAELGPHWGITSSFLSTQSHRKVQWKTIMIASMVVLCVLGLVLFYYRLAKQVVQSKGRYKLKVERGT